MELKELLKHRDELLNDSKDENGSISETSFIQTIIPSMLDAKLIDHDDFTETFYVGKMDNSVLKINGYIINESGERLQIFVLNESSIDLNNSSSLHISRKDEYENMFRRAINFSKKSIKGHLNEIPDIGAINALVNQLSSSIGSEQFDVIEVFLISATATISHSPSGPIARKMEFDEEKIKVRYTIERKTKEKEIVIFKRLIDLNFLYSIFITQGNREVLDIDFAKDFDYKIESIKAADEDNFESYLCVLPAPILSELYRKYSFRLLEKNVRSFLQFRGVNKGMRHTLQKEPEKFIAFNNGLTITSSFADIKSENNKTYIVSLRDFQIVNGGQTTASIYFSQKDGIDVRGVNVMAKINVIKNISEDALNDLISSISLYSNSQSRVSSVDLRSRNPQLNKIKLLSESIMTPSGRKWFFEKSKGEFNTKLRIAGSRWKKKIEKEYPRSYRFTKEQLGKHFCAWGNEPYKVKKGGEAIFRKFIETISPEENNQKIKIDRNFYEVMISKITLFKAFEKIYGERKNAIGHLRSAVVPYSIAIIYNATEGDKKNRDTFNFFKIWKEEGVDGVLESYAKELMILMNSLIKKYSQSDDHAEYSRKQDLWREIECCHEIKEFMSSQNTKKVLDSYAISKKEFEQRLKGSANYTEVDFSKISDTVSLLGTDADYFRQIRKRLTLAKSDILKIEEIIHNIENQKAFDDIEKSMVFNRELIHRVTKEAPEVLDIEYNVDNRLPNSLEYIIRKYNASISRSEDIVASFDKISKVVQHRKIKFSSVFSEIGRLLSQGTPPSLTHVKQAAYYVSSLGGNN